MWTTRAPQWPNLDVLTGNQKGTACSSSTASCVQPHLAQQRQCVSAPLHQVAKPCSLTASMRGSTRTVTDCKIFSGRPFVVWTLISPRDAASEWISQKSKINSISFNSNWLAKCYLVYRGKRKQHIPLLLAIYSILFSLYGKEKTFRKNFYRLHTSKTHLVWGRGQPLTKTRHVA